MTKGERIRHKRESLRISQTDLAKNVGISKQTLYKYENDIITNIPSDVIELLAARLNCSPAYIMGWNDQKEDDAFWTSITKRLQSLSPELLQDVLKYLEFAESKKEE